jgi:hypothetical protein
MNLEKQHEVTINTKTLSHITYLKEKDLIVVSDHEKKMLLLIKNDSIEKIKCPQGPYALCTNLEGHLFIQYHGIRDFQVCEIQNNNKLETLRSMKIFDDPYYVTIDLTNNRGTMYLLPETDDPLVGNRVAVYNSYTGENIADFEAERPSRITCTNTVLIIKCLYGIHTYSKETYVRLVRFDTGEGINFAGLYVDSPFYILTSAEIMVNRIPKERYLFCYNQEGEMEQHVKMHNSVLNDLNCLEIYGQKIVYSSVKDDTTNLFIFNIVKGI